MDVQIDAGIQNTLSKFTEDFSEYDNAYKIRLYLDILESDNVDINVKNRVKQLNKEIIRLILFEEDMMNGLKKTCWTGINMIKIASLDESETFDMFYKNRKWGIKVIPC